MHHHVASGALLHSIQIGVGLSCQFAQERRNYADTLASRIIDDFEKAFDLTEDWDAMLDGKWAKMMSQAVYDAVPNSPSFGRAPQEILSPTSPTCSYAKICSSLRETWAYSPRSQTVPFNKHEGRVGRLFDANRRVPRAPPSHGPLWAQGASRRPLC